MSAAPPSKPPPTPGYVIRLRPLATGWRIPPEQRLRALLKSALRGYGFVCTGCQPDPAPGPNTASDLAPPVPQERLPIGERIGGKGKTAEPVQQKPATIRQRAGQECLLFAHGNGPGGGWLSHASNR
jgi:hypothetical protein